jgi:hypothetical protein
MATLDLPQRPYQRPVMHVDDIGRALDRSRILLDNAIRELLSVAHTVDEAQDIAEALIQSKERLVRAWDDLAEPELPLEH